MTLFPTQTYLGLYHCRSLGAQYSHRLEYVQHTLVLHPLEHDAERDKDASATDARTAMHRNRTILAELFLCFVHLANEVDKTFARLWYALFRPVLILRPKRCATIRNNNTLLKYAHITSKYYFQMNATVAVRLMEMNVKICKKRTEIQVHFEYIKCNVMCVRK